MIKFLEVCLARGGYKGFAPLFLLTGSLRPLFKLRGRLLLESLDFFGREPDNLRGERSPSDSALGAPRNPEQ